MPERSRARAHRHLVNLKTKKSWRYTNVQKIPMQDQELLSLQVDQFAPSLLYLYQKLCSTAIGAENQ